MVDGVGEAGADLLIERGGLFGLAVLGVVAGEHETGVGADLDAVAVEAVAEPADGLLEECSCSAPSLIWAM